MRHWMGLCALGLTLASSPAWATAQATGTGTGATTGTGTGAGTGTGTGASTATGTGSGTGTGGVIDTGPTGPTYSAAELAGEKGGCGEGCNATGDLPVGFFALPLLLAVRRRR